MSFIFISFVIATAAASFQNRLTCYLEMKQFENLFFVFFCKKNKKTTFKKNKNFYYLLMIYLLLN